MNPSMFDNHIQIDQAKAVPVGILVENTGTDEEIIVYSKYYEELDTVAQKRYREKLKNSWFVA